jgi:quercetin dioxygenase-like cupin family protein
MTTAPTDVLSETRVTFPLSGEHFEFVSPPEDRSRFTFDFRVDPGGGVTQEHRHAGQVEVMRCVSGSLDLTVDGGPLRLGPGDEVSLPPGSLHTLANNGAEQAHFEVEYQPAGRNREWFQLIAAFQHMTGREPNLLDLAPFIPDVDIEIPGPARLQRVGMRYILRPLAIALGRRRRMLALASTAYGRPFTW